MPDQVNGLPTHVLLVHAVVVLLPLCALLLVAGAVLPRVQARLGGALPLLAAGCVVLVPLTTEAGQALARQVGGGDLVREHAALADRVLPWAVALLAVSLLVWWRGRRQGPVVPSPRTAEPALARTTGAAQPEVLVRVAVAVLAVAVAAGTVVQVARTGESGARAVWSGTTDSS